MSKPIGYTFAIATRKPIQTYVFCKWLKDLAEAVAYAEGEIKDRSQYDIEFILIREGVDSPEDPVVWDSRTAPKPVVTIWTHTTVPEGFPLAVVHAQFEKRAASVLSDYDSPVSFATWTPALPTEKSDQYDVLFDDGRYVDVGVRTAWMMYLDLALEHYDRFGTAV